LGEKLTNEKKMRSKKTTTDFGLRKRNEYNAQHFEHIGPSLCRADEGQGIPDNCAQPLSPLRSKASYGARNGRWRQM